MNNVDTHITELIAKKILLIELPDPYIDNEIFDKVSESFQEEIFELTVRKFGMVFHSNAKYENN